MCNATNIFIVFAALMVLGVVGCGPSYQSTYPSYEAIVAQYVPDGKYQGERLDAALAPDCDYRNCGCPRIWYDNHWVYYCHGCWVYWYHGYWYHYPYFYVHYRDGGYYAYTGSVKHITQGGISSQKSGRPVHYGAPPSDSSGSVRYTKSRSKSRSSSSRKSSSSSRSSSSSSSRSSTNKKKR